MIDNTMSLANAQYKVHEVKPLQSKQFKKDADVAKDLLDRACWQVQPIMKKRKWSVPVVAEMPPKNTGPIGVNYNAGKRITVMLRKPTKYTLTHLINTGSRGAYKCVRSDGEHFASLVACSPRI